MSEGQLANTSASSGSLHGDVAGGADGDGLTALPPPPFASPTAWGQIYELSGGVELHMCALAMSLCGAWVHTSLFVLLYRPNTPAVALPSLIGGPVSISAMPAQDWRSALIFL